MSLKVEKEEEKEKEKQDKERHMERIKQGRWGEECMPEGSYETQGARRDENRGSWWIPDCRLYFCSELHRIG